MPGLEELEVELEALRARNLEVEDLLREAGEAAAAVEAAKRLAEISDRPNKAPQKAKWLVDIISPIDDDLPKISRQIDRGGQTQLR